jgi:hypothetical protein
MMNFPSLMAPLLTFLSILVALTIPPDVPVGYPVPPVASAEMIVHADVPVCQPVPPVNSVSLHVTHVVPVSLPVPPLSIYHPFLASTATFRAAWRP